MMRGRLFYLDRNEISAVKAFAQECGACLSTSRGNPAMAQFIGDHSAFTEIASNLHIDFGALNSQLWEKLKRQKAAELLSMDDEGGA